MTRVRRGALLLWIVCAGCAPQHAREQAQPVEDEAPAAPRAARCFRVADVYNWRVIDDRQLIVYAPGRRDAWHLRLFATCTGLRFTEVLAFRAAGTDRICGDPGDEIAWRGNRCSIAAVRAVSPAEVKALLDKRVRDDIGRDPAVPRDDDKGKHPDAQSGR